MTIAVVKLKYGGCITFEIPDHADCPPRIVELLIERRPGLACVLSYDDLLALSNAALHVRELGCLNTT